MFLAPHGARFAVLFLPSTSLPAFTSHHVSSTGIFAEMTSSAAFKPIAGLAAALFVGAFQAMRAALAATLSASWAIKIAILVGLVVLGVVVVSGVAKLRGGRIPRELRKAPRIAVPAGIPENRGRVRRGANGKILSGSFIPEVNAFYVTTEQEKKTQDQPITIADFKDREYAIQYIMSGFRVPLIFESDPTKICQGAIRATVQREKKNSLACMTGSEPLMNWESVKNDLKAIHVAVDAKHGNRGFRFSWEVPASDENVEEVYKAVVFPAGAY